MPYDARVHVGVAAWVTNKSNQVLMVHRALGHGQGEWGLPGGWLDYGETYEQAVLRELAEETGLVGSDTALRDVVANTHESYGMHVVCVICDVIAWTGEASNLEADKTWEVRWVHVGDMMRLPLFSPLATHLERRWGITAKI